MDINIHEIYHLLLEGRTLELGFPNKEDAEEFRVRLSQYKKRKDAQMVGIGMMEEREKQKLSYTVQQELQLEGERAPACTVTIQFKDRDITKIYSVKILDSE